MESKSTGQASQDLYRDSVAKYGPLLERLASAYEADPDKRHDMGQEIHFNCGGVSSAMIAAILCESGSIASLIMSPVILAIGTFILTLAMVAGRKILPSAIPFVILFVAWVVTCFVFRTREQREVKDYTTLSGRTDDHEKTKWVYGNCRIHSVHA